MVSKSFSPFLATFGALSLSVYASESLYAGFLSPYRMQSSAHQHYEFEADTSMPYRSGNY